MCWHFPKLTSQLLLGETSFAIFGQPTKGSPTSFRVVLYNPEAMLVMPVIGQVSLWPQNSLAVDSVQIGHQTFLNPVESSFVQFMCIPFG